MCQKNGSGPPWAILNNAYTERGKLRYGIERGIPLNIPSHLWPERRAWLLEMEEEYREAGRDILAQWCRQEIACHDSVMAAGDQPRLISRGIYT